MFHEVERGPAFVADEAVEVERPAERMKLLPPRLTPYVAVASC